MRCRWWNGIAVVAGRRCVRHLLLRLRRRHVLPLLVGRLHWVWLVVHGLLIEQLLLVLVLVLGLLLGLGLVLVVQLWN